MCTICFKKQNFILKNHHIEQHFCTNNYVFSVVGFELGQSCYLTCYTVEFNIIQMTNRSILVTRHETRDFFLLYVIIFISSYVSWLSNIFISLELFSIILLSHIFFKSKTNRINIFFNTNFNYIFIFQSSKIMFKENIVNL